jgi:hypothetical protein
MQVAEGSQSMLAMISSPPCVAGDAIIVEAAAYSELTTAVSAGEEISIVVSGSSGTPYGSGSHGRSAVVAYVRVWINQLTLSSAVGLAGFYSWEAGSCFRVTRARRRCCSSYELRSWQ